MKEWVYPIRFPVFDERGRQIDMVVLDVRVRSATQPTRQQLVSAIRDALREDLIQSRRAYIDAAVLGLSPDRLGLLQSRILSNPLVASMDAKQVQRLLGDISQLANVEAERRAVTEMAGTGASLGELAFSGVLRRGAQLYNLLAPLLGSRPVSPEEIGATMAELWRIGQPGEFGVGQQIGRSVLRQVEGFANPFGLAIGAVAGPGLAALGRISPTLARAVGVGGFGALGVATGIPIVKEGIQRFPTEPIGSTIDVLTGAGIPLAGILYSLFRGYPQPSRPPRTEPLDIATTVPDVPEAGAAVPTVEPPAPSPAATVPTPPRGKQKPVVTPPEIVVPEAKPAQPSAPRPRRERVVPPTEEAMRQAVRYELTREDFGEYANYSPIGERSPLKNEVIHVPHRQLLDAAYRGEVGASILTRKDIYLDELRKLVNFLRDMRKRRSDADFHPYDLLVRDLEDLISLVESRVGENAVLRGAQVRLWLRHRGSALLRRVKRQLRRERRKADEVPAEEVPDLIERTLRSAETKKAPKAEAAKPAPADAAEVVEPAETQAKPSEVEAVPAEAAKPKRGRRKSASAETGIDDVIAADEPDEDVPSGERVQPPVIGLGDTEPEVSATPSRRGRRKKAELVEDVPSEAVPPPIVGVGGEGIELPTPQKRAPRKGTAPAEEGGVEGFELPEAVGKATDEDVVMEEGEGFSLPDVEGERPKSGRKRVRTPKASEPETDVEVTLRQLTGRRVGLALEHVATREGEVGETTFRLLETKKGVPRPEPAPRRSRAEQSPPGYEGIFEGMRETEEYQSVRAGSRKKIVDALAKEVAGLVMSGAKVAEVRKLYHKKIEGQPITGGDAEEVYNRAARAYERAKQLSERFKARMNELMEQRAKLEEDIASRRSRGEQVDEKPLKEIEREIEKTAYYQQQVESRLSYSAELAKAAQGLVKYARSMERRRLNRLAQVMSKQGLLETEEGGEVRREVPLFPTSRPKVQRVKPFEYKGRTYRWVTHTETSATGDLVELRRELEMQELMSDEEFLNYVEQKYGTLYEALWKTEGSADVTARRGGQRSRAAEPKTIAELRETLEAGGVVSDKRFRELIEQHASRVLVEKLKSGEDWVEITKKPSTAEGGSVGGRKKGGVSEGEEEGGVKPFTIEEWREIVQLYRKQGLSPQEKLQLLRSLARADELFVKRELAILSRNAIRTYVEEDTLLSPTFHFLERRASTDKEFHSAVERFASVPHDIQHLSVILGALLEDMRVRVGDNLPAWLKEHGLKLFMEISERSGAYTLDELIDAAEHFARNREVVEAILKRLGDDARLAAGVLLHGYQWYRAHRAPTGRLDIYYSGETISHEGLHVLVGRRYVTIISDVDPRAAKYELERATALGKKPGDIPAWVFRGRWVVRLEKSAANMDLVQLLWSRSDAIEFMGRNRRELLSSLTGSVMERISFGDDAITVSGLTDRSQAVLAMLVTHYPLKSGMHVREWRRMKDFFTAIVEAMRVAQEEYINSLDKGISREALAQAEQFAEAVRAAQRRRRKVVALETPSPLSKLEEEIMGDVGVSAEETKAGIEMARARQDVIAETWMQAARRRGDPQIVLRNVPDDVIIKRWDELAKSYPEELLAEVWQRTGVLLAKWDDVVALHKRLRAEGRLELVDELGRGIETREADWHGPVLRDDASDAERAVRAEWLADNIAQVEATMANIRTGLAILRELKTARVNILAGLTKLGELEMTVADIRASLAKLKKGEATVADIRAGLAKLRELEKAVADTRADLEKVKKGEATVADVRAALVRLGELEKAVANVRAELAGLGELKTRKASIRAGLATLEELERTIVDARAELAKLGKRRTTPSKVVFRLRVMQHQEHAVRFRLRQWLDSLPPKKVYDEWRAELDNLVASGVRLKKERTLRERVHTVQEWNMMLKDVASMGEWGYDWRPPRWRSTPAELPPFERERPPIVGSEKGVPMDIGAIEENTGIKSGDIVTADMDEIIYKELPDDEDIPNIGGTPVDPPGLLLMVAPGMIQAYSGLKHAVSYLKQVTKAVVAAWSQKAAERYREESAARVERFLSPEQQMFFKALARWELNETDVDAIIMSIRGDKDINADPDVLNAMRELSLVDWFERGTDITRKLRAEYPEELKELLLKVVTPKNPRMRRRSKRISDARVRELADSLGLGKVLAEGSVHTVGGQKVSSAEVWAALELLGKTLDELDRMLRFYAEKNARGEQLTDVQASYLVGLIGTTKALSQLLRGAASEAGRTLRLFRFSQAIMASGLARRGSGHIYNSIMAEIAQPLSSYASAISEMSEHLRARSLLEEVNRSDSFTVYVLGNLMMRPNSFMTAQLISNTVNVLVNRLIRGVAGRAIPVGSQVRVLVEHLAEDMAFASLMERLAAISHEGGEMVRRFTPSAMPVTAVYGTLREPTTRFGRIATWAQSAVLKIPAAIDAATTTFEFFHAKAFELLKDPDFQKRLATEWKVLEQPITDANRAEWARAYRSMARWFVNRLLTLDPEIDGIASIISQQSSFRMPDVLKGFAVHDVLRHLQFIHARLQPFSRLVVPVLSFPIVAAWMNVQHSALALLFRLRPNRIWRAIQTRDISQVWRPLLPREAPYFWGRVALGTLATILGYYLRSRGVLIGELPQDPDERRAYYRMGVRPYSIRIGDRWIDVRYFQPFFLSLMGGVALYEIMQKRPKPDATEIGLVSEYVTGLMRTMGEQTVLYMLENYVKMLGGSESAADTLIGGMMSALVPGYAIARTMRLTVDPVVREVENPIEYLMNQLPYVSRRLRPRYGLFGEEELYSGTALDRFVHSFFLSGSVVKRDPRYELLVSIGFTPAQAREIVTDGLGNDIYLHRELYELYVRESGRMFGQLIAPIVDAGIVQKTLREAGTEEKKEMVAEFWRNLFREMLSEARNIARMKIVSYYLQHGTGAVRVPREYQEVFDADPELKEFNRQMRERARRIWEEEVRKR